MIVEDFIELLREWRAAASGPAVLVTVASTKGSVPRAAGTKMLVTEHGVMGTIGGGHLEFTAIAVARRQLDGSNVEQLQRFVLGASLGQCCGGVVNLLFEPIAPDADWVSSLLASAARGDCVLVTAVRADHAAGSKLIVAAHTVTGTLGSAAHDASATAVARERLGTAGASRLAQLDAGGDRPSPTFFFDRIAAPSMHVVLFGAGHVGRALAAVLANIPCSVSWVDSRDDAFPAPCAAHIKTILSDFPKSEVDATRAGAMFLVMTHSHALDEQLTEQILRRDDFAYFGLIGSLAKRRQFERRLASRGVDPATFERMTCPIGIEGVDGKEPGVIAVAVAAQLLQAMAVRSARSHPARDANALGPVHALARLDALATDAVSRRRRVDASGASGAADASDPLRRRREFRR